MLTSTPVIEVDDAAVALGGRPVLRQISMTVGDGQFVAFLGANGSGKSTLVRALVGLVPITAGSVRLFGTPLEEFTRFDRIGFVPQRAGASGGVPASVWEVVASGRITKRRLLRRLSRDDRRAITDALEVVGLGDRAAEGVSTLSGGQQQRVLIARALASGPDLLFLDEPTAGVDLPNQSALADSLAELSARGATIVLVAHELGPLAGLLDRSIVLRDGRIAYDGPPLDDHAVHHPDFAGGDPLHQHHHPDLVDGHMGDHTPAVSSPFDGTGDGGAR